MAFEEDLEEKPRFIEVVDEDGRVTTLQATSFDMESTDETEEEEEEELVRVNSIHSLKSSLQS